MCRRFAVMMILYAVGLTLSVVGPTLAQTALPASATFVNGRVLLNGSVILNPATEAPGCPELSRISYSPDTQWFLVLLKCQQVGSEAFVFRADGTGKRHVTGPADFVVTTQISWSPDSRWLLYERDNELVNAPEHGEPETGIVRCDV